VLCFCSAETRCAAAAPRWQHARRGFGTVRFFSKEDADTACEKLNNTDFEGRMITVRLDRFA
jgi:hypothetical protein